MGDLFRDNRRLFLFIIISNFLLNFGFQVWQTLFNNFAVDQLGMGPAQIGVIQAVREIPGLLGFAIAFLALFMTEFRIMTASITRAGDRRGVNRQGYRFHIPDAHDLCHEPGLPLLHAQ